MNSTHFYQDKPLFGLDIGFKSIKVMQISRQNQSTTITGYGVTSFDQKAVDNGTIVDHENIAASLKHLFSEQLIGDITTHRVAFSVPAARTFTRILTMPRIADKDIAEAVSLEAEQYIPVPIGDLYIDFEIIHKTDKDMAVLVVAVPKKIVDSYETLAKLLGLEVIAMETTISSTGRLFRHTDQNEVPTVLIDFGSVSSDVTIFNKTLVVTGTIPGGGDNFTELIAKQLGVSREEAHVIKAKYGLSLSKKQAEIMRALEPMLEDIIKEVRRMIRYYEERSPSHKKIEQIVTLGGGANMPGLSEYLTDHIRVPVRACDPWSHLSFGRLKPPATDEQSMYLTSAGLALINPGEVFV